MGTQGEDVENGNMEEKVAMSGSGSVERQGTMET